MIVASVFLLLHAPGVHAQNTLPDPSALPEGTVASVNGHNISRITFDSVTRQIGDEGGVPDPQSVLDELINLEVLAQAAETLSIDKQPQIAAALRLQYTQTLANAYLAQQRETLRFSEAELRDEYAVQSAEVDRAEYRISHILTDTQEQAADIISQLSQGGDFSTLAARYSTDASAHQGGDLGWMTQHTLFPEFADALTDLSPGTFTTEPVHTEYGYHVIRLDERRDAALPDFEAVREGIANLLARKALAAHIEELRSAAQVKTH